MLFTAIWLDAEVRHLLILGRTSSRPSTRLEWMGQALGNKLVSISPSLLREGENPLRLIAEGGPGDVSLVDFDPHHLLAQLRCGCGRATAQVASGEQVRYLSFNIAVFNTPQLNVMVRSGFFKAGQNWGRKLTAKDPSTPS